VAAITPADAAFRNEANRAPEERFDHDVHDDDDGRTRVMGFGLV